jgi:predicted NAD/FAD-binding protein
MRVAIIGTGIAALGAAHRLHPDHDITLFEASSYVGGHTATVNVEACGGTWAVDTGFIVFNEWTYPNFVALMRELGVAWQPSNMSFSLRCERSGLEYNGTSLDTVFAQRRNLLRPSFLRMLTEILRFNATAAAALRADEDELTLGEFLRRHRYSQQFIDLYVIPMGRAIWSASAAAMLVFPARFFVEFFGRHGFLSVNDRPTWLAICGGSRNYVHRLSAPFRQRIRLNTAVTGVHRNAAQVMLRTAAGHVEHFDHVILACHADQALALLEDPSAQEREVLRAFPYQENEVLLHTDARLLPRTPRARAAWNYHLLAEDRERVAITYDMNRLMSLTAPVKFLVTINRSEAIDPRSVLRSFTYHHPVYTPDAVRAQQRRAEISGVNRTSYAGAYWGAGFHEDGLVSGYRAAAEVQHLAARQCEPLVRVA